MLETCHKHFTYSTWNHPPPTMLLIWWSKCWVCICMQGLQGWSPASQRWPLVTFFLIFSSFCFCSCSCSVQVFGSLILLKIIEVIPDFHLLCFSSFERVIIILIIIIIIFSSIVVFIYITLLYTGSYRISSFLSSSLAPKNNNDQSLKWNSKIIFLFFFSFPFIGLLSISLGGRMCACIFPVYCPRSFALLPLKYICCVFVWSVCPI